LGFVFLTARAYEHAGLWSEHELTDGSNHQRNSRCIQTFRMKGLNLKLAMVASGFAKTSVSTFLLLCSTGLVASGNVFAHEDHVKSESPIGSNSVSSPSKKTSELAEARLQARLQERTTGVNDPGLLGQWSEVSSWPILAVHANLLPTGQVIAWDATPDDFDDDPHTIENYTTRVTVWDPIADTHREAYNDTNADLFCSGSSHLWDGRIVFAGGDSGKQGRNGPLSNVLLCCTPSQWRTFNIRRHLLPFTYCRSTSTQQAMATLTHSNTVHL